MNTQEHEIHVYVDEADLFEFSKSEVREGLLRSPKELAPYLLYDEKGSELFEEITELPEYYQTRTEKKILGEIAPIIEERYEFRELLELGSGSSYKTRVLLDEMHQSGQLELYLPFDVSESMVRQTAEELSREYPEMGIYAIVGDFNRHLGKIPSGNHRLLVFLGGTIGNFKPQTAETFLRNVARTMDPSDRLLLGTDLVKDTAVIEAAYNDSRGVTAAFNRNSLKVVNDRLGANFKPDAYEHRAIFDTEKAQIEMHLIATSRQDVRIEAIDLDVRVEEGEYVLSEISRKFTRSTVESLLASAGLEMTDWFTDPEEKFALSLGAVRG